MQRLPLISGPLCRRQGSGIRLSLSEQIVLKPVSLPPREPRSLTIPGEIEITGIRGN